MLVAVVVAHGGEVGRVAVQRFGVERRTVVVEASAQFGGQVLGVGSAASVAAEVDLAAALQRGDDDVGSLLYASQEFAVGKDSLLRSDALFN